MFVWPQWFHHISWLWTNGPSYNLWSSEWGGLIFKLWLGFIIYLIVRPLWRRAHAHLECHVSTCNHWGHPVAGTGYRACHEHHPVVAHEPGEEITAEHIAEAHRSVR